jgi:hypothetical protein
MANLVEPVFETDLLATLFSMCIARTCMMSGLVGSPPYSLDMLTNGLPKVKWPDTRFQEIQKNCHLLSRTAVHTEMQKRLLAEEWRELMASPIRDFRDRPDDIIRNVSTAMMSTLWEVLYPLYPELEEEFQDWRTLHLFEAITQPRGAFEASWALSETVKSREGEIDPRPPTGEEVSFEEAAQKSLEEFGSIYLYAAGANSASTMRVQLLRTENLTILAYDLSPEETQVRVSGMTITGVSHQKIGALNNIPGMYATTVMDEAGYASWLQCRKTWRRHLSKPIADSMDRAFVHAGLETEDFIGRLLKSGAGVKAFPLEFRYLNGPEAKTPSLGMVLYKPKGDQCIFFHLATPWTILSVKRLVQLYRDQGYPVRWAEKVDHRYAARILMPPLIPDR